MITAVFAAIALAVAVHVLVGLRARQRAARPEAGVFAGLLDELALPSAEAAAPTAARAA